MKYLLTVAAAAAGVAAASPHNHKHAHLHERDMQTKTDVVATATVFEVNGTPISKEDACHGVDDGEYTWKNSGDAWGVCSTSSSAAPTTSAAPSTTSKWSSPSEAASSIGGGFYEASSSAPAWSAPAAVSSSAPSSSSGSGSGSGSGWSGSSGGQGVGSAFPDGQLDCSTFPSDYGALPVNYLGFGGWSGLQAVTIAGGAVDHIVTGVSGESCTEGMMCSYACPPGYQKSQWPSTQGATGQSIGGLSCSGGKLHLTNSGLSSSLCVAGKGGVTATNNAGQVVAICRTDYPGTESETIPVELQPGETEQLTVPDAGSYYQWQGKSTSAQYYLNPPGYGASDACQWGSPGKPIGNYAPINFGVGYSAGKTWLSIFQNAPTTNAQYPGTVEIKGDNLSGSCKYQNGQYCSGTGCNSNGCTVCSIHSCFLLMANIFIGCCRIWLCQLRRLIIVRESSNQF